MIWIAVSLIVAGFVMIEIFSLVFWKMSKLTKYKSIKLNISLILIFNLWFLLALVVAYNNITPLVLPLFILVPIITILIAKNRPYLKEILSVTASKNLILLQLYRLVGIIFLIAHFKFGLLSLGFILAAAVGDIITGLLAIVLGFIIPVSNSKWRSMAVIFNFIGIGDLVIAPFAGLYFGAEGIISYPLYIVPLFLGPPLGIVIHILSLKNLQLRYNRDSILILK